MAKGCASCLRVFLIVLNTLFVFIGLALIGLAVWMYYDSFVRHMETKDTNLLAITLFTLMGIGGLTVLIGICGCCGSYHENKCLLGTYFFVILIIMAGEVAAAIIGMLFRAKVEDYLEKVLNDGVTEIRNSPEDISIKWMDYLQKMFKCCGANNYTDYGTRPPKSCCHGDNATCSQSYTKWSSLMLTPGCKDEMKNTAKENIFIGAGVVLGIALLEMFAMILSIALCCSIRKPYDQYASVKT